MADSKTAPKKPLLRLRSHFSTLLVFYHHPVRLTVSLAIPFMMLPELSKFVAAEWQMSPQEAQISSILGILIVIFLPQLLASALNCSSVRYTFFDDHVEYTESFFVPDVIKMSYSSIKGVSVTSGVMQKLVGVADIALVLHGRMGTNRNTQQLQQVIRDVKRAKAAAKEIENILKAWQARAKPADEKAP